jgi:hypothetical protein
MATVKRKSNILPIYCAELTAFMEIASYHKREKKTDESS